MYELNWPLLGGFLSRNLSCQKPSKTPNVLSPVFPMNQTLKEKPYLRHLVDFLGISLFATACVLSKLGFLPMWGAILCATIGATFSTRRNVKGAIFAVVALLCFSILKSFYDSESNLVDKLSSIISYDQGSRILLCAWVYAISQIILSVRDVLRGQNEHNG